MLTESEFINKIARKAVGASAMIPAGEVIDAISPRDFVDLEFLNPQGPEGATKEVPLSRGMAEATDRLCACPKDCVEFCGACCTCELSGPMTPSLEERYENPNCYSEELKTRNLELMKQTNSCEC